MNILCFTGNLGKTAEQRRTQDGTATTSFSVAMKSGFGQKAVTSWVNCTMWGKRGEAVAQYLVKGQLVAVSGELTLDEWQGNDGQANKSLKLRVNDLTLLGKAESRQDDGPSQPDDPGTSHDLDDEVPF